MFCFRQTRHTTPRMFLAATYTQAKTFWEGKVTWLVVDCRQRGRELCWQQKCATGDWNDTPQNQSFIVEKHLRVVRILQHKRRRGGFASQLGKTWNCLPLPLILMLHSKTKL